jgi:hypothetical protein
MAHFTRGMGVRVVDDQQGDLNGIAGIVDDILHDGSDEGSIVVMFYAHQIIETDVTHAVLHVRFKRTELEYDEAAREECLNTLATLPSLRLAPA